jgi:glycerol-3-phosphate dehydrogenase
MLTRGDSTMADFDLAIIGGGINGAGIARDAAGRGLRVLLVEQNDLASGTSSASTKLIHGGLRYLELHAFRLVREALAEREVLLRIAPHLIRPMRFVLPHQAGMRSAVMLRLGLFVYDHLSGRNILPSTKTIDLTHHPCGIPLKRAYSFGFEYSDCRVDDARLVVLNALDAAEHGAAIRTRTRCTHVERGDEHWRLVLNDHGVRDEVTARVLVNATGPWVASFGEIVLHVPSLPVRLVKGSHIVVRRLFDHDRAYIFQNPDGRVEFAIPYERDFTLIGTTDIDFAGDPSGAAATEAEIVYLTRAANAYFREAVTVEGVAATFAGVRPLHDDGTAAAKDATRDYIVTLDAPRRVAPLLTVYGGKITTYRRLAELALDRIAHFFAAREAWTAHAPLPGGEFPWDEVDVEVARARTRWPFLSEAHARRLIGAYGTRIGRVLGDAQSLDELGPRFGADLTGAEVQYLRRSEWAETAEDVLVRRSKIGLHLGAPEREAMARFMASAAPRRAAAE